VARNRPAWWKYPLQVLALAALYLLTARLGLTLALPPEQKATAVWLPSGISLVALLLAYRLWPGVWLGAFLANFWDFFSPSNQFSLTAHLLVSGGIALGSTLQPLLGTFLLHRLMGQQNLLEGAANVLRFTGVGLVMCLVAATIGVTTLYLAGFAPLADYHSNWWTWWLGDTIGVLIVTPLVLAWRKPLELAWGVREVAEAGLLLVMLLVVGLWVFGRWELWGIDTRFLGYLAVPLLVWTAFRFGQQGATLALLVLMGIAVWGTTQDHGPFVLETQNESLLLLQTFMGVLAVTTLTLAGTLAERKRIEGERARLMMTVEQERATLAAVMASMSDGLLVLDATHRVHYCNARVAEFLGINHTSAISQPIEQIITEVRQETTSSRWENLLTDPHQFPSIEVTINGPPQRILLVSAFPVTDATQEGLGLLFKDVTTARALALLEERERIAMDIHDGVIQSLYGVALSLSTHERLLGVEAEETRQALQRARTQISNIIQELRDVIFDLRQHRHQLPDLQAGLKSLATELFGHTLIHVDLELEEGTDCFLDPVRVSGILYIAREAMSNVIRHAGASKVVIHLARIEEKLVLTIRDNGRGFNPTATDAENSSSTEGQGLRNMAERAQLLGGRLLVVSSPGNGTEVYVEVRV
jgi:signal transduction histidine kinase